MSVHDIKKQLTAAWGYSSNRLALNDFAFYELWVQEEIPGEIEGLWKELQALMRRFLEGESPVEEIRRLRMQTGGQMERLAAYTDALEIYEHMINRLEARFHDMGDGETDEERIQWLLRYIMRDQDSVTVNQRIQQVMGQLPVRLTKQKFFSYLREAVSIYVGGARDSADKLFYMLETAALLKRPQGLEGSYERLGDCLRKLEAQDFSNVSAEDWERLEKLIKEAGMLAEDYMVMLTLVAEMVNDLLVAAMTRRRIGKAAGEESCGRVLQAVWDGFNRGGRETLSDELLKPLEGKQEEWYERWDACCAPMDRLEQECAQDMDAELLRQISLLVSNSTFAPLEHSEPDLTPVSREEAEERAARLENQLSASWKGRHRLFVRAVMAKLLCSLPVFFGSISQVQEYITGCLESCTDEAEKGISMNLIRAIAGQEGAED